MTNITNQDSPIKPVKVLNKDLITSGYSNLLDCDEYRNYAEQDHSIATRLIPALEDAHAINKNHQGYKAVTQALFESRFLCTTESDFNLDELINHIYGVKAVHAVPAFLTLHQWLTDNDYTDHLGKTATSKLYRTGDGYRCIECDTTYPDSQPHEQGCTQCTSQQDQKTWNPSGDNYYSAYTFPHKYSESEQAVCDLYPERESDRPVNFDRVIVMENQSPMWAAVLMSSAFSEAPRDLFLVKLKSHYKNTDRLPELLELVKENKLEGNFEWRCQNSVKNHGIIAHVSLEDMYCKPALQPKLIEGVLFNIYSGRDSIPQSQPANEE